MSNRLCLELWIFVNFLQFLLEIQLQEATQNSYYFKKILLPIYISANLVCYDLDRFIPGSPFVTCCILTLDKISSVEKANFGAFLLKPKGLEPIDLTDTHEVLSPLVCQEGFVILVYILNRKWQIPIARNKM